MNPKTYEFEAVIHKVEDIDGAYIEILSGVNEGDTISSIPPNLDPRSKE